MNLNRSMPGLPRWPVLTYDPTGNTCEVTAKHVSYRRFSVFAALCNVLIPFVLIPGMLFFGFLLFFGEEAYLQSPALVPFIGFLVVFLLCDNPRLLCYLFRPKRTRVVFSKDHVAINGNLYPIQPDMPLGFRAQRHPLTDYEYQQLNRAQYREKFPATTIYKLKYRVVEMVYGSTLVEITTVADQARAEQFALVLQKASSFVQENAGGSRPTAEALATADAVAQDDNLPE